MPNFIYLSEESCKIWDLYHSLKGYLIYGKNYQPPYFEKVMQDSLLSAIKAGLIRSAHDCAEGGLAVALAECCISNKDRQVGATVSLNDAITIYKPDEMPA